MERKRRREGPDQTKSKLLAFPKVRRWLRSWWWVSRGFLPHSFTQPHLPLQSKEVHSSVLRAQNVFLWQHVGSTIGSLTTCGHREPLLCHLPPLTVPALCAGLWLQSLFFSEMRVGRRSKQKQMAQFLRQSVYI